MRSALYGYGMDDAWAVVWGAGIALVASVIGGFMSSVVGPLVSHRADQRIRDRSAADDRRAVLQRAILDASVALRAYWFARSLGDDKLTIEKMDVAERHMLTIKLWTTEEESAVGESLMRVLAVGDVDTIAAAAHAWEDVAARWFRGSVSNEAFVSEFERVGDDRIEFMKELAEEKRATANEGPSSTAAAPEG